MEIDARRGCQDQLPDGETDNFRCACAGIVQKQEESLIAGRQSPVSRQAGEQLLDLVAFQIACRWWLRALPRDGGDALGFVKQFWRLASDEPEEGMQHRQSMVPRSNIVAALGFKIGEESSDVVGAEIGERQFADRATSCLGHEEKEKADSVAVTSNGCLGKPPLGFEVMLKELVDQAADGRHGWSPVEIGAANRSKRRPAASMRSVVIVRYTAVEIGSTCPMNVESFMR